MFSTKRVHEGTTEDNIAEEEKEDHEEVNYPCGHCGKHFSQKGHLATHQRGVHEGVKYPCGQCGLKFSQKTYIARHHRSVHIKQ